MLTPDQEELTIKAGGSTLGGWQRIRVTRGVELCPSHFEIEMTERFPGQVGQLVIEPTTPCTVMLSGDLVLTGFIDRYMPRYNKHSHRVRLIGRSKTQDIVDCSIDVDKTGWEIKATTIGQAAKVICQPYNINVSLPDGDFDLPGVLQQALWVYPGYTGYFILEEMARSVGVLVWDDAQGNLVISKGGTGKRAGSGITEGVNAEMVEAVWAADARYAQYRVLGMGPDQINSHINFSANAFDPESSKLRNRLRIIPQEIPDPKNSFSQIRAYWEANRRWGRSRQVRVEVTGWRDGSGKLWTANSLVSVNLPTAKVNEDRAIAEVSYLRDEDGTRALLTLMPAQALQPQPFTVGPITPL
jgi:prophage tail gpP-like protein